MRKHKDKPDTQTGICISNLMSTTLHGATCGYMCMVTININYH